MRSSLLLLVWGDSSYEHFCGYAHLLAKDLQTLGAQSVLNIQECDVDYQVGVDVFLAEAQSLLAAQPAMPETDDVQLAQPVQSYTKYAPYVSDVQLITNLCTKQAHKTVRHIEFYAPGLRYQPGDCLGIVHDTPDEYVSNMLQALQVNGNRQVEWQHKTYDLTALFTRHTEIVVPQVSAVRTLYETQGSPIADQQARDYVHSNNWLSIVRTLMQDKAIDIQAFVSALPAKKERLYSIASCPISDEEQVHILVKQVQKSAQASGLTSAMYINILEQEQAAKIFVKENSVFRLPTEATRPIIMIGAGTGIAPFRSFIRHRQETGATGKNWLFFGEQYFKHSFFLSNGMATVTQGRCAHSHQYCFFS